MNYPDNWFCINCKKQFEEHVKIGDPNQDHLSPDTLGPASANYCYTLQQFYKDSHLHGGWSFEPVDNLTQIELLAKYIKGQYKKSI
jgi:hypothetical protein